jgi:hypothetical protein
MTLAEAQELKDKAALKVTALSLNMPMYHGKEREHRKAEYLGALKNLQAAKAKVRHLSDLDRMGYHAGLPNNVIDHEAKGDDSSAGVLLLEALKAIVEMAPAHPVAEKIREYFRPKTVLQKPDNSDLDFSTPDVTPSPRTTAAPQPAPMAVSYLDANHRSASGPGSVLYGRRKAGTR